MAIRSGRAGKSKEFDPIRELNTRVKSCSNWRRILESGRELSMVLDAGGERSVIKQFQADSQGKRLGIYWNWSVALLLLFSSPLESSVR